jgi:hypothetical protein
MSLPSYSDDSVQALELGILGSLFGIAMLAFVSRIASRLHPYPNLGWDDFAITVAAVSRLTVSFLVDADRTTGSSHG